LQNQPSLKTAYSKETSVINGFKLLFGTHRKCAESIGVTMLLTITGILVSEASYKLPPVFAALSSMTLVALMLGLMHYALMGSAKTTRQSE
jgi:hypothetical protein